MKSKNHNLLLALATAALLFTTSAINAESVVIKQDQIFIADNGLIVKDLHTDELNTCAAPPLFDIANNDVTDLLSSATDVAIKEDYAVVTIHPLDNEGNPFIDTVTIDVSSCFEHTTVTVEECISTVDMHNGRLVIPCVEVNGSYMTVHMDRRGKSSNWEVTFTGNNHDMEHYNQNNHHDDDDDHHH